MSRLTSTRFYSIPGFKTTIKDHLAMPKIDDPLPALSACNQLESLYRQSANPDSDLVEEDPKKALDLLKKVLEKSELDQITLRRFFTLEPSPSSEASISVLEHFNKTNPNVPLSQTISMIPFRRATYNCDFDSALELMDLSTGLKSHYGTAGDKRLRKYALAWSVGVCGVLVGVNALLESGLVGQWDQNKNMVLGMVFTYCVAVSIYAMMALSGPKGGAGQVLHWARGTPFGFRIKYTPEIQMASTIAEMNRSLPENHGECAPKLLEELKLRSMEPVESKAELDLKEYWARGGAGFEWVEPDQDPAEELWRQKMEREKAKRIGSPYVRRNERGEVHDWAQDVLNSEQNRTLPHASLIDISALSGPEKMAMLEEEMKKLQDEVDNLLPPKKDGEEKDKKDNQ